jgi:hypothetical protein
VLLLAATGLVAVVRHRLAPWLPGLLMAGCLTAIHAVYWSDMRMRAPLMPLVALLAAYALCPAAWTRENPR